jgi:molybdenum cofactor cytidylyltransferase
MTFLYHFHQFAALNTRKAVVEIPDDMRRKNPLRAQKVDVEASEGQTLCSTIFRQGGKKLLSKGHVLNATDIHILRTEGLQEVWVVELEEAEVGEDDATFHISNAIGSGALEVRHHSGGRASLVATHDCCVLVDEDLLKVINSINCVAVATISSYRYAKAGEKVATVKSAPFAVDQQKLDTVVKTISERGAIVTAMPIKDAKVGILYSDPMSSERAKYLFESFAGDRVTKLGAAITTERNVVETDDRVAQALKDLIRMAPTVILIASTTAPAGPEDTVGRAMMQLGVRIERFLAPVDPGSLLLLGYSGTLPILSAPGCFNSRKTNVLDLVLPPLLARHPISGWEIAAMGHGGLLD